MSNKSPNKTAKEQKTRTPLGVHLIAGGTAGFAEVRLSYFTSCRLEASGSTDETGE